MILRKRGVLVVRIVKPHSAGEGEPLDQLAGGIQKVDGVLENLAVVCTFAGIPADFEGVLAKETPGGEGICGGPTHPRGVAVLLLEVVPGGTGWGDDQVLIGRPAE